MRMGSEQARELFGSLEGLMMWAFWPRCARRTPDVTWLAKGPETC